ncbi:permease [Halorubrum sp. SD683]|uniref:permease n=1 Tax=Halorubrum sp. SD683 TaxID=1855873 RepID=UPI000A2E7C45|nr:permease [Halorubrum sp. SD683]OTF01790.1 permease [Halorubrum sp. SD683]
MNARTVALALGTAVTTFLLVGAATIELLGAGEAPGIGIIGVFAGFVAGLAAGVLVGVASDRIAGVPAAALLGYAAFGTTFLAIAAMSYVNVPGVDDVFTFPVRLGVSAVVAVVAALATAYGERSVAR